jgi:XTP/dITP diphosphohydrolase
MKKVFVATSNKGKQAEIAKYSGLYGKEIQLLFPDKTNEIKVDESGTTFEENARLKALAYKKQLNDDSIIYVGDDSGIKIPVLNNEPGVFTRRWAGYEMTDREILDYCMEKLWGITGDDRKAIFQTVLAVVGQNDEPRYLYGTMAGHILEKPIETTPIDGFPFRSIFWVDEIDRPIYEVHGLTPEQRGGFLTHREKAFKELFEALA